MSSALTETAAPAAAMHETSAGTFGVTLDLEKGYAFLVDPGLASAEGFVIDEPAPLGDGRGPNPTRVLASSIAACLGSSLLFCLRKGRVDIRGLKVRAEGTLVRNARGRLRVAAIRVELLPSVATADAARMSRCLEVFEDFCIVTASIRQGVDVTVSVSPQTEG